VLTADCVRESVKVGEGKGLGKLCVYTRLC